jgi:hypothetical protein
MTHIKLNIPTEKAKKAPHTYPVDIFLVAAARTVDPVSHFGEEDEAAWIALGGLLGVGGEGVRLQLLHILPTKLAVLALEHALGAALPLRFHPHLRDTQHVRTL